MTAVGIRSAIASGARSMAASRLRTTPSITVTSSRISPPFSSAPTTRAICVASRLASGLGILESQRPLHSAIAGCRLRSILATDSTYWSSLSQGLALPL